LQVSFGAAHGPSIYRAICIYFFCIIRRGPGRIAMYYVTRESSVGFRFICGWSKDRCVVMHTS
jgi:hypothetical protein